jgi:hypothetical protein
MTEPSWDERKALRDKWSLGSGTVAFWSSPTFGYFKHDACAWLPVENYFDYENEWQLCINLTEKVAYWLPVDLRVERLTGWDLYRKEDIERLNTILSISGARQIEMEREPVLRLRNVLVGRNKGLAITGLLEMGPVQVRITEQVIGRNVHYKFMFHDDLPYEVLHLSYLITSKLDTVLKTLFVALHGRENFELYETKWGVE